MYLISTRDVHEKYQVRERKFECGLTEEDGPKAIAISAQDGMLINKVIVVQNPYIPENAACVENRSDCPRYILLTVIPDVLLAYEMNLPVLQTMGTFSLSSWEFSRATTRLPVYD